MSRALLLGLLAGLLHAASPVADEQLRLAALRAAFPGMAISPGPTKPEGPTAAGPKGIIDFPDAMRGEQIYVVAGAPVNQDEECAASDLLTGKVSHRRDVQMKLFRWPGDPNNAMLAVLQYGFKGANPPGSCWSIRTLARIARNGVQFLPLPTMHHHSIQKIELDDLDGSGVDDLVIESSIGGAGLAGSTLQVFDLRRGGFDEVLQSESRIEDMEQNVFTESLDILRTRLNRGRSFCVERKTLVEDGKQFRPPLVTRPCYAPGNDVNRDPQ